MLQTVVTIALPCSRNTAVHTHLLSSADFSQFVDCLPSSSVSKVTASLGMMNMGQLFYKSCAVLFVTLF